MKKIFGLLNLETLKLGKDSVTNFKNYEVFCYRLSELGAETIVALGKQEEIDSVINTLEKKLDIPIISIFELDQNDIVSIEDFLNGKTSKILLLDDNKILQIFNERLDLLPNLISLIAYKAKTTEFEIIATTDIESAKLGLKLS